MHDWEVTGRWSLLKWNWNSFNSWNQQLEWSKWMSSCFYYCRQVFQSEKRFVPNRRATDLSPLAAHLPKRTGLLVLKNALSPRLRLLFARVMVLDLKQGCGFKHNHFKGAEVSIGPLGRLARPAGLACVAPVKTLLLRLSAGGWLVLFLGCFSGRAQRAGWVQGEMESWELVLQGDHTEPSST